MPRAISSLCQFCERKAGSHTLSHRAFAPSRPFQTHHVRFASRQAEQRQPKSRQLSKDVSKAKLRDDGGSKRTASPMRRNRRESPFGGMNQRFTNIGGDNSRSHKGLSAVARLQQLPDRGPGRKMERKAMSDRDGDAAAEVVRKEAPKKARNRMRDPNKPKDKFHALRMQSSLSEIGYGQRTAVKRRIAETESFEELGLLPAVQAAIVEQALKGLEDATPTPIQKLAIPALLGIQHKRSPRSRPVARPDSQQFLLAAETGSGKTLAYLIPSINAMKIAEVEEMELEAANSKWKGEADKGNLNLYDLEELEAEDKKVKEGRPRIVILVPTAELVDQVGSVVKQMSHKAKFRTSLISSSYTPQHIRNGLFKEVDVVVTTPQLWSNIAKATPTVLSRVTNLIIDEADSLLDKSFEEYTTAIIDRAKPTLRQLVFCSATIPRRMDNYLRNNYPDVVRLTTPNLHAIPRRVQLGVVDCNKGNFFNNKDLACADTIWSIGRSMATTVDVPEDDASNKKHKRIIVFVNEREKANDLAKYLQAKGIDAMALNRDSDDRQEKDLIAEFTGVGLANGEEVGMSTAWENSDVKKKLANTRVLVTTDIASRGIDTTPVRDVILYDVPHSSIDFIHRLGRTGRMGRRGRGIVLVGKDDRRDIVSEVKHGMFLGQALI